MVDPNFTTYAKLIVRLGSTNDNEILATVAAIQRLLKADGHDWHWLAALIASYRQKSSSDLFADAFARSRQEFNEQYAKMEAAREAGTYIDHYHAIQGEPPTHEDRKRNWLLDYEEFLSARGLLTRNDLKFLKMMRGRIAQRWTDITPKQRPVVQELFGRCWTEYENSWVKPEDRAEWDAVADAAKAERERVWAAREAELAERAARFPVSPEAAAAAAEAEREMEEALARLGAMWR